MSSYILSRAKFGSHYIIAQEIGRGKTVLDVGCNKGFLSELNPDNTYYGIDYDEQELAVAKARYKKVYKLDLNESCEAFKEEVKFDVIVFADILEHLVDPGRVLRFFLSNYLKTGGRVMISLPNVAHFTVRFRLLIGKFDYQEIGILDKTHLHFYTLKTSREFISQAGLKIDKVRFCCKYFGFITRGLPFMGPLLGYNNLFICRK